MESFSKLDKAVFEEFQHDKKTLQRIALKLKQVSENSDLTKTLFGVNDEEDNMSVNEGRILYRLHKARE